MSNVIEMRILDLVLFLVSWPVMLFRHPHHVLVIGDLVTVVVWLVGAVHRDPEVVALLRAEFG